MGIVHSRSQRDPTLRVFDNCPFGYGETAKVTQQMGIFLVIMTEMELLGYEFFCGGNISGRYSDREADTTLVR